MIVARSMDPQHNPWIGANPYFAPNIYRRGEGCEGKGGRKVGEGRRERESNVQCLDQHTLAYKLYEYTYT